MTIFEMTNALQFDKNLIKLWQKYVIVIKMSLEFGVVLQCKRRENGANMFCRLMGDAGLRRGKSPIQNNRHRISALHYVLSES